MRNTFLLILVIWLAHQTLQAQKNIAQVEVVPVFLNVAQGVNNKYAVSYYDSVQEISDRPHDIFFCHIAKSLRLSISDIPTATQELIHAKTYFSKNEELLKYVHHLELAEANMYTGLGKYEKAETLIDQSIHGFDKANDAPMRKLAQLAKVNILANWGKFDEAYLLVSDLFQNLEPSPFRTEKQFLKFEISLWNRKATLLTTIANSRPDSVPSAKAILEKTIALAKERNDEYVYYNATGNLSYIYYLNQAYAQMIPLALEDLSYSERRKSLESIGGLHTVLADAYFNLGQKDSAQYHLKQAEEYSKFLRNKFIHQIFVEVARKYYQQSGDLEEAFQSLNAQYAAINAIYKSIDQISFDLSKAETNLSQAEEQIQMLDLKNRQNVIISWLLGLLALSIGLLAIIFYRLHQSQKKFRNELEQINQNLESEIERRTKEVVEQSEKIKAAAYHNSHRTRAPVARLLGLVDILNTEIPAERDEIVEYIRQSAKEIDEVIIDMNEVLSKQS